MSLGYPLKEARGRLASIEDQELDSPLGILSVELYTEFLGLYLLTKDLSNAKLLWKRIPADMKTDSEELKAVWEVGKTMWKRDYSGFHAKINACEWSEVIKRIMLQYKMDITEHCFSLVAGGYTSIELNYLANMLGLTPAETIAAIQKKQWTYIEEDKIIKPVKTKKDVTYDLQNEEHLEKLTRHILYLET